MINKSISYRLSIYVSFAVIIVFIAFNSVFYVFERRLIKENIENQAIGESLKIIRQVEKLVVSTREVTSNISDQIIYYGMHNDADIFLNPLVDRYPYINAIHVNIDSSVTNLNNHNFFSYREDSKIWFNRSNKSYYDCEMEKEMVEQVLKQNSDGWTEPFRCSEDGPVVVSYIAHIQIPDGENETLTKVGEVICELSLLELSDSINAVKIGDNNKGYAFLVSQNGDFITHPNKDWILNRNLLNLSDGVYDKNEINIKEIIANQSTGIVIAYSEFIDYQKSWVYYTPIKETGWLLVFVLPYNELFQPLYIMLLKLLFLSVIGILIIYFAITLITNKLVEPLSTVTTQLKKFSNLSGRSTINTLNEVKLISESLDYIKGWYKDYQASQYKEKKKSIRQLQDLEQASEIQQSLVRTNFSSFSEDSGIDLFAIYRPANIVSGDLFDYFFKDEDNIVFTIGDVSGKGVPAAIFMSIAQTIIKGNATVKRAKNIVKKASSEIYTNNQHQFFLTLFVGVLNVKTGVLNYCNAAHTSTLILKQNKEIIELNKSDGLPLGLYPDKEYSDRKIQIEKGDIIILFTDGITELLDNDKKFLGIDNFIQFIVDTKFGSVKELVIELEKKIDEFRGEAKQIDDITLFAIQY